jgi:hypothetical protein
MPKRTYCPHCEEEVDPADLAGPPPIPKPLPREEVDLARLKADCQAYLQEVASSGGEDSNLPHYIFECAMETFYGNDIFSWVNRME